MKKIITNYLLLLPFLLIMHGFFALSQAKNHAFEYQFQSLSSQNGLSQNTVNDIVEDSSGFIWIGTENGLNRFDGVRVRSYLKNAPKYTIAENAIVDLHVDQNGGFWVLTRNFILKKHADKFEVYLSFADEPLVNFETTPRMIKSSDDGYLFLIGNKAVYEVSQNKKVLKKSDYPQVSNTASWFVMDSIVHNNQVILSTTKGLWIYNDKKEFVQPAHWPEKLKKGHIQTALKNNKGIIVNGVDTLYWLDSRLNISSINTFKSAHFSSYPFLLSSTEKLPVVEKTNHLWFASATELFQWTIEEQEENYLLSSMPERVLQFNSFIQKIFVDSKKNVWLGTSMQGVFYLSNDFMRFKVLQKSAATNNNPFVITAIHGTENTELWIGTSSGEIYHYDKRGLEKLPVFTDNLMNNPKMVSQINDIVRIKDQLWLGTLVGLLIYDLKTHQVVNWHKQTNTNIVFTDVLSLKQINNELWVVSSNTGVFRIDLETHQFQLLSDFSDWNTSWRAQEIISVLADKETVYLGTSEGQLIGFDRKNEKFNLITAFADMSQPIYMMKKKQNHEVIWFITNDTLFEYNLVKQIITPHIKAYDVGQAAFYSLQIDELNRIWIGGSRALVLYDPGSKSRQVFSAYDGALTSEYNSPAYIREGVLFAGNVAGVTRVDTHKVVLPKDSPEINIEYLLLTEDKKEAVAVKKSNVQALVMESDSLIRVDISPAHASQLQQIKLRYRINDNPWITIDNWRATLAGSQFGAGNYNLSVQSAWLYSDNWKDEGELSISVLGLWGVPVYIYWIVASILMLLFIASFKLVLSWRYNAESFFNQRVEKRTATLSTQLEDIEKLHQLAKILFEKLDRVKQVVIEKNIQSANVVELESRLWQLITNINSHLIDLLPAKQELLINHFLVESINHNQSRTNGRVKIQLHESQQLKTHFSPFLIRLCLEATFLYIEFLGSSTAISINVTKSSARRGGITILSRLKESPEPRMSDEYSTEFYAIFEFLSHAIQELHFQSDLSIKENLFSWKLHFPVAQIWRGTQTETQHPNFLDIHFRATTKSSIEKQSIQTEYSLVMLELADEIEVEKNQSKQPEIQKTYFYQRLSEQFSILVVDSIDSAKLQTEVTGSEVIIVRTNDVNQKLLSQLYEISRECCRFVILVCPYSDFEWLRCRQERPDNLLVFPKGSSPELIGHVLEFVLNSEIPQLQVSENENGKTEEVNTLVENSTNQETVNDDFIERLNAFLEVYCADDSLDVEKVAYELKLSSRHLARKMKYYLNSSTAEYIKTFRLQKALKLLRKGLPVKQVAKMTGFSSRSYFSTCFKKEFGVVPSDYKKIL